MSMTSGCCPDRCLGPKEAGVILGCCERTATRLMQSGELEAFRMRGKLWRTTHAKIAAYQNSQFGQARRYAAEGIAATETIAASGCCERLQPAGTETIAASGFASGIQPAGTETIGR